MRRSTSYRERSTESKKSNQIWLDFKRCIYRRLFRSVSLRARLRQRPNSRSRERFPRTLLRALPTLPLRDCTAFSCLVEHLAPVSLPTPDLSVVAFSVPKPSTAFVLLSRNTCRRDGYRPESDSVSFYGS